MLNPYLDTDNDTLYYVIDPVDQNISLVLDKQPFFNVAINIDL